MVTYMVYGNNKHCVKKKKNPKKPREEQMNNWWQFNWILDFTKCVIVFTLHTSSDILFIRVHSIRIIIIRSHVSVPLFFSRLFFSFWDWWVHFELTLHICCQYLLAWVYTLITVYYSVISKGVVSLINYLPGFSHDLFCSMILMTHTLYVNHWVSITYNMLSISPGMGVHTYSGIK